MEIINSYSENTDPLRQRQVFEKQMEGKSEEERAKIGYDEDFIIALTYGLPPVAGLGLGIERLVQWLLNLDSIKDVIPFPAYKLK
jgi:lysyl-tRNA synthetase class 2